jgi:hypothetical protein
MGAVYMRRVNLRYLNLALQKTHVFGVVAVMQLERDSTGRAITDVSLIAPSAIIWVQQLAPYRDCPRAPLPVADSLARRVVSLPSSAGLA